MMQIRVNGLKIDRLSPFEDDRGCFVCVTPSNLAEMHSQYPEVGFSVTRKNVLRGLHGSNTSSKLITLVNGKVFWVCVDLRELPRPRLSSFWFTWDAADHLQILVPNGVVVGFYVLSDVATMHYMQSEVYSSAQPRLECAWNDPVAEIPWPVNNPILSELDSSIKFLGA